MKKYIVRAKFASMVDFPVIEAKNQKEALEKAEFLLLTDHHLQESQDDLIKWEIDALVGNR